MGFVDQEETTSDLVFRESPGNLPRMDSNGCWSRLPALKHTLARASTVRLPVCIMGRNFISTLVPEDKVGREVVDEPGGGRAVGWPGAILGRWWCWCMVPDLEGC